MKKTTVPVAGLRRMLRGPGLLLLFTALFCMLNTAFAQSVTVSGTVKDEKGDPVSSVSVNIKGTKNGTATGPDGKFTITVPNAQAVLVFSSVGYGSKERTVGTDKSIEMTLVPSTSDLDDVVVIGYGQTQKKRDVTGSISQVTSKQIQERQPVTLFDALQGQAAGVLVTNDNGDPAGQGTIQIRGASTLNGGNGPLWVIDGIISENGNFLNPADIETFEILKDASSAAIYGARAANGVILVTTKRGKEGKPMITANYSQIFGKLAHKLRTTSADELRYYRRLRGDGNGGANLDSLNPYLNADNDYQDLLFRTSDKKIASVSIGGGKQGINYYAGLTYTDDNAAIINSWIKRLQSKINISYQASPKLRVSHTLTFAWQYGNTIPIGNSAKQVFERNPWTAIYRPDGTLASYVESKRNPVAQALLTHDRDNNFTVQFNTQLNYQIYKDLKFTTLFNAQLDNNSNIYLSPASLTSGGTGNATGSNGFDKRFYWETQGFLNYTKVLAKKHNITGLLGVSADRRRNDGYLISMYNYLSEEIMTSNAGLLDPLPTKTRTTASAQSNASLFSRLGYSFEGKYIVQGTYRRDGSSRFGPNNKWGNFFSGSAAWRFSDEKFMNWTKGVLYDGKLRYSIGKTGNDRIGDYGSYTNLNFGDEYYNGALTAAENTTLGNSNIQWETTISSNIGLDLSFFKGRLTFVADYYQKTTKDLLYTAELPKETGKSKVIVNLGTIQNKGMEFTLGATPIVRRNFSWDLTGNISFQRGTIEKLNNGSAFLSGSKWWIQEGGHIGDFFMWRNLGVYQWNESNAYDEKGVKLTPVLGTDNKPIPGSYTVDGKPYSGVVYSKSRNGIKLEGGDTEWLDRDNNGIIDENDKEIVGNAVPDFYFGITNNVRYKNFTLSFLFNGQIGNKVYNQVANAQNTNASTYTPPIWDAILYSWQQPGDISKYPLFSRKDARGSISSGTNSLYMEDGSFIRLSSVRLTYNVHQKLIKKLKMKGGSVYAYGSNLATWTDYSWYDPEFSSSGLNIGEDNGKYPKRREIGFGINLNF